MTLDWSFVPGIDLAKEPTVTKVDGGELREWGGCRIFVPDGLGEVGPAEAKGDGCRSRHGAPQETVEAILDRLWPILKDVKTARQLGKVIVDAGVPKMMKRPLALAARDLLRADWRESSMQHWLAPKYHSEESLEQRRATSLKAMKAHYAANRDNPIFRDKHRAICKAYYLKNPTYASGYAKARRKSDQTFKLVSSVRLRIRRALKAAQAGKADKSLDLLGCTAYEYKSYLESKFANWMSWENYGSFPGGWVIDHLRAIASFDLTDPEQQRQAFHYMNTIPLAWEHNMTKSSWHGGRRWAHADHK